MCVRGRGLLSGLLSPPWRPQLVGFPTECWPGRTLPVLLSDFRCERRTEWEGVHRRLSQPSTWWESGRVRLLLGKRSKPGCEVCTGAEGWPALWEQLRVRAPGRMAGPHPDPTPYQTATGPARCFSVPHFPRGAMVAVIELMCLKHEEECLASNNHSVNVSSYHYYDYCHFYPLKTF